jgi:hypothetical protein
MDVTRNVSLLYDSVTTNKSHTAKVRKYIDKTVCNHESIQTTERNSTSEDKACTSDKADTDKVGFYIWYGGLDH